MSYSANDALLMSCIPKQPPHRTTLKAVFLEAEAKSAGLWLRCYASMLERAAFNGDRVSARTAEPETLRTLSANPPLPVYCGGRSRDVCRRRAATLRSIF